MALSGLPNSTVRCYSDTTIGGFALNRRYGDPGQSFLARRLGNTLAWHVFSVVVGTLVLSVTTAGAGRAQTGQLPGSDLEAMRLVPSIVVEPNVNKEVYLNEVKDLCTTEETLFVLQGEPPELLRFTRDGRLVHRIGQAGDGPGEFQAPQSVGCRSDSVWVSDKRHSRLTLLTESGDVARTSTFHVSDLLQFSGYAHPHYYLADGSILATTSTSMGAIASGRVAELPVYITDLTGEVTDTLLYENVSHTALVLDEHPGRNLTISLFQPFRRRDHWDVSPDGSAVVVARPDSDWEESATLELSKYSVGRGRWMRHRIRYEPRRLPEESVAETADGLLSEIRSQLERHSSRIDWPALEREFRDELAVPDAWAPVSRLLSANDGTVWLRREGLDWKQQAAVSDHQGQGDRWIRWDVLGPQGQHRAAVRTPATFHAMHAEHDQLWGVLKNRLDLPRIVSYRLPDAPE